MNQESFDSKVQSLYDYIDMLNIESNKLLGNKYQVFEDISIPVLGSTTNEAAFIRLTSFYYVLFFEVGKVSIDFLVKEYSSIFNIYGNDFRKIVHSMRTMFHHNLIRSKNEDIIKIEFTEDWFQELIHLNYPTKDTEWEIPLIKFLEEGESFLNSIGKAISYIDALETKDIIIETWKARVFNDFKLHNFEKLFIEIAKYFGLDTLNPHEFCIKHKQKWSVELSSLSFGYDFNLEASKLIERDLIIFVKNSSKKMPISGNDIMIALGCKPDKRIGFALTKSQEYFMSTPCTKEELLEYAINKYKSYGD